MPDDPPVRIIERHYYPVQPEQPRDDTQITEPLQPVTVVVSPQPERVIETHVPTLPHTRETEARSDQERRRSSPELPKPADRRPELPVSPPPALPEVPPVARAKEPEVPPIEAGKKPPSAELPPKQPETGSSEPPPEGKKESAELEPSPEEEKSSLVEPRTSNKMKIYNGTGRRHTDDQIDEILDEYLMSGKLPRYVSDRQRRDYRKHKRLPLRRMYLEQAGIQTISGAKEESRDVLERAEQRGRSSS